MSNVVVTEFTESCSEIKYPCKLDGWFPDPCDCSKYFRCDHDEIIGFECAKGTGWDHNSYICDTIKNIHFKGVCDTTKPWTRCSQTDNITSEIGLNNIKVNICNITANELTTTIAPLELTTTIAPLPSSPAAQIGNQSGSDAGAIAGGVIGGILAVLIIVVIIVIIIRKRSGKSIPYANNINRLVTKKKNKQKAENRTSVGVDNLVYDNKREEVYAEIKDDMDDPAYNPGVIQSSIKDNHLSPPTSNGTTTKKWSPILPHRGPKEVNDIQTVETGIQSNADIRSTVDKPDGFFKGDDSQVEYDNRAKRTSYVELVDVDGEQSHNYTGLENGQEPQKQDSDENGYLVASTRSSAGLGENDNNKGPDAYYVIEDNTQL